MSPATLPRRAADTLRRRVDWRALSRAVEVAPGSDLTWLGTEYGGWNVPLGLVEEDWIVYSGGVGEDTSFDEALIQRKDCQVWAFDPTPRAVAHAEAVAAREPCFHFMPVGLWDKDEELEFFEPADPDHASWSADNLQGTAGSIKVPCRSLESLAAELGHDSIDLLKLDIEGAEYPVLRSMLAGPLRPAIMCVELHRLENRRDMAGLARQVVDGGYRVVWLDRDELTFVRADLL